MPIKYYIDQAIDYYPYGKPLREYFTPTRERYLTTQHERDAETNYDNRGARLYDADVMRFLSVDPLAADYAAWSGYNYVLGNPLRFVDPDGRYVLPAELAARYSKLDNYLRGGIATLLGQADIRDGLKTIGSFSDNQIDQLSRNGEGITINILQLDNDAIDHPQGLETNGYTPGNGTVQIDATLAQQLQDASTPEAEQGALLGLISTILHETTHEGFNSNAVPYNKASREISNGAFSRTYNPGGDFYTYFYNGNEVGNSNETGRAFENAIWYNGGKNNNFGFLMKQGMQGMTDQGNLVKDNTILNREQLLPKQN